ncbi:hypothetical protein LLG96_20100 [bacterium]|nr:hypothetical protein [bacterium]
MKRILLLLLILFSPAVYAGEIGPVTYHLAFESLDFTADDWIAQTGLKTIGDRKWELIGGKFGKALFIGAVPLKYDNDNMSGLDLDMVTAVIFNVGFSGSKGRGYDEPFIWGAGKLHPASGAVSFWVQGTSKPESEDTRTVLFEQTTSGWGRKERQLIEVELYRDRTISAYVEDARYVQHMVKTKPVWNDKSWNHVVFMWDRSSGVSLWVNGKEAASTMGTDAWWENQRPGLFHMPMSRAAYDEFYIFNRPLTGKEISALIRNNAPPVASSEQSKLSADSARRLRKAFIADSSMLPAVQKSSGDKALVFTEITPERIHDEGIQGWWISDGRYEMAWPHEYSVFTIIPGDVDFHAEKADILPPPCADVNYITIEGNLDDLTVIKGDRSGNFPSTPHIRVPKTDAFFFGALSDGLGNSELRIPFTKSYGAPPGFEDGGGVLRLPESGDLRIHEVGLFNVAEKSCPREAGDRMLYMNAAPIILNDTRYPAALGALLPAQGRTALALTVVPSDTENPAVELQPMTRINFMSEPAVGKAAYNTVILDIYVTSPVEDNVLAVRLLDPAVPSHTWTHAEMKLRGFTGAPGRLRVALTFDPMFLVEGDRIWIELLATEGLSIEVSAKDRNSGVILRPVIDWAAAEPVYALKTLRPTILTYGRSFEYIPWQWDKRMPDVDAPVTFGGMYDMAYPWQAVHKVNRGDRIANIYRAYTMLRADKTLEYPFGRYSADIDKIPDKAFTAPENAPDWAVYFREYQTFRNRIVTWWRHHQRTDGQAGGGWNDDTLIFSRTFGDMQLDSNEDALILYNTVFDGFDRTNYFKDGYCRIFPIDRLHNGDFVRERYKSLIYNLGDPRSAVWAMEEAWHWGKPDKTPMNYGDGRGFLFGKDVLEWYWGRRRIDTPYKLENPEKLIAELRKAAVGNNDTTLWRFTESWNHTDDQSSYGTNIMQDVLLGGWGVNDRSRREESNIDITVGVGWLEGGGPETARLVEYSGNDGLRVNMYSFADFPHTVVARLFRLDPGVYALSLKADEDGDGTYEGKILDRTMELKRFDRLAFTLPPQIPVKLEITQVKASPLPGDLPDLAVSSYFIRKEGGNLTVTVHNIGSAPSGSFTVALFGQQGSEIKRLSVDSLPGCEDFVPKQATVTFTGIPEGNNYLIVVDRDNEIKEILKENNSVLFTVPGK